MSSIFFLKELLLLIKIYIKSIIVRVGLGNGKKNECEWQEFEKSCLLECTCWEELGYEGGGQDVNRQQGEFGGEQF